MELILAFLRKHKSELISFGLVVLTYVPTFLWMWERWFARDSYYSHGILIPFVSLYLIWNLKDDLKLAPKKSSSLGLPILVVGILLHLASAAFRIYFSSGFSLVIVLMGLVLHFYGRSVLRLVSFPLFFLIFMIPIPIVTIINISFKLKIFAAKIATTVLNDYLRIQCFQDGSIIRMQNAQVIVDDVCSGLRYLISLTALGSIFAYWIKAGIFKKIIVFISSIPIAVFSNALRVIFLSVVSEIWGVKYATGFLHDFSGFIVFAVAFVLLYAVVKLLE